MLKMGFKTKIIVAGVIVCGLINFFLCFNFIQRMRETELQRLATEIDYTCRLLRVINAGLIYDQDIEKLKINLEFFMLNQNMKSIWLKEIDGDTAIHYSKDYGYEKGMDIKQAFVIDYRQQPLADMKVVYNTTYIENRLTRFRNQMFGFTFSILLIVVMVLVILIEWLVRPVTDLSKAACEIAAGDLDKEIKINGIDEIGELARNFSDMRASVKEKIEDLAKTNLTLEKEVKSNERHNATLKAINTLFQEAIHVDTYDDVAGVCINLAEKITNSKFGFIGEINDRGLFDNLALTDSGWEKCKMPKNSISMKFKNIKVRGVMAKVLNKGCSVIINDPALESDMIQTPEKHPPIDSFLGVPMKFKQEAMGLIGLAGKDGGYDIDDQKAVEMLSVSLVEALQRKKGEKEKAKLEEMMIQSEKMLSVGGLAAGMAHEINNPLAGIIQNTQVLTNRLTKDLPANISAADELGISMDVLRGYMEKRGIFSMIHAVLESGKRAAGIVENMLSFARKSTSGFLKNNIAHLVDKTIELAENDYNLKKKFDFKQIKIEREYDTDLPSVPCDAGKFQQVVLNILSNGAQSMAEKNDKDDFWFKIRLTKEEKYAKLEIRDNGPGMDEETRKRVFEPFFTTKKVGVGTGLGLSVSYFIITENHKGNFEVESSPGNGANFIIKLPLNQ